MSSDVAADDNEYRGNDWHRSRPPLLDDGIRPRSPPVSAGETEISRRRQQRRFRQCRCQQQCQPQRQLLRRREPCRRPGRRRLRSGRSHALAFVVAAAMAMAMASTFVSAAKDSAAARRSLRRIRPMATTRSSAEAAAFACFLPAGSGAGFAPQSRRRRSITYLSESSEGGVGGEGADGKGNVSLGGGGRISGGKKQDQKRQQSQKQLQKQKQNQKQKQHKKQKQSQKQHQKQKQKQKQNQKQKQQPSNAGKGKAGSEGSAQRQGSKGNHSKKKGDQPSQPKAKSKQQQPRPNQRDKSTSSSTSSGSDEKRDLSVELLKMIADPYRAGSTLRRSVDAALGLASALTNAADGGRRGGAGPDPRLTADRRSIYYDDNYCVDDRLGLSSASPPSPSSSSDGHGAVLFGAASSSSSTSSSSSSSPNPSRASSVSQFWEDSPINGDARPEVLIVGAAGEVGRLVAKRLLLESNVRVRVLVRDLYSSTLERLGTGVTYCQGDLNDVESLEYAVTDVDKIVFCAGPPRKDEENFKKKFREYWGENQEKAEIETKNEGAETKAGAIAAGTDRDGGAPPSFGESGSNGGGKGNGGENAIQWDELESMLDLRAKLAENVDLCGLRNLVHAYQNVRHADYGTSQAAKRSLFKFGKRPVDFDLFGIDVEEEDKNYGNYYDNYYKVDKNNQNYYSEEEEGDGDSYEDPPDLRRRPLRRFAPSSSAFWKKNKFGHGVFVGKVRCGGGVVGGRTGPGPNRGAASSDRTDYYHPNSDSNRSAGEEAAVSSSRLRSRNDPERGIDLRSGGFAGFVCRVCSNGGTYEAFVRTGSYDDVGAEYVREFETSSKPTTTATTRGGDANRSPDKFATVRLEFAEFAPRMRRWRNPSRRPRTNGGTNDDGGTLEDFVPPFDGRDVRQIGFRYRSNRNPPPGSSARGSGHRSAGRGGRSSASESASSWSKFYLALDYIKVYRSQPEPEFVYLSDARIPPVVRDGMVRHDVHRLTPTPASPSSSSNDSFSSETEFLDGITESLDGSEGGSYSVLDTEKVRRVARDKSERSEEETYFKYRGEEILKQSGLSYTIIRVAGYNENTGTDSSGVRLQKHDGGIVPVSRADVAQVCSSALLEPNACNLVLYMTRTDQRGMDGDVWQKFARLKSSATTTTTTPRTFQ